MTTLVLWEVQMKPGFFEAALEVFQQNLPGTRAFPGCQRVDAYRNEKDGDNLLLVEYWDSWSDYEKYYNSPDAQTHTTDFMEMVVSAPGPRSFELLDT